MCSASCLFLASDSPGQSLTITCGIITPLQCMRPFYDRASYDRHAAVHGQGVADHVARRRAAQPEHGRGDLLGPARAADGDVLRELDVRLLAPAHDIAGDLRVDQAGVDR